MFLEAEAATAGGLIQLFVPFVVMLAFLYFFLIRPQQKQQKERQAMLDGLNKGDKVVTIGGIYGEVVSLTDDFVTLKIGEKSEIKLSRSGIGSVEK